MKVATRIACILWGFKRAEFYRGLADAYIRKVAVRDFLAREFENARLVGDWAGLSVIRFLSARLASGDVRSLERLFERVVPKSDVVALSAVDAAGDQPAALEKVADFVDFKIRNLKTISKQLMLPAVSAPLAGGVIAVSAEIMVSVSKDTPPEVWTGFNGFARALAFLIVDYWFGIVLAICALMAVVWWALPHWTGRTRAFADEYVPGFGLYRDHHAAVMLSSIAMMISSGLTVRQALEDLRSHANPWLKWHIRLMLRSLQSDPTDYLTAFSRGLMPKVVRARLGSLTDSAKSFDDALIALGTKEIQRLERRVALSASSFSWALMGAIGTIAVILSVAQMTVGSSLAQIDNPVKTLNRGR